MDRRGFFRHGAVLGAVGVASSLTTRRAAPPAPRSDEPLGARTGAVATSVVWRTEPATPSVALTFDDGPDPRWTPRVLDLLARHRARATFYVVGSRAEQHPDLLRRVVDAGHELGNHSWSHTDLATAPPEVVRAELTRTAEVVQSLTGVRMASVRPPWGHIDPVGLLTAAELGCSVVLWSELVRASAAQVDLAHCLREVRPGSVVLAHDGGPTPNDAELVAVDALLTGLRGRGLRFDTVSDVLGARPAPAPLAARVALPS